MYLGMVEHWCSQINRIHHPQLYHFGTEKPSIVPGSPAFMLGIKVLKHEKHEKKSTESDLKLLQHLWISARACGSTSKKYDRVFSCVSVPESVLKLGRLVGKKHPCHILALWKSRNFQWTGKYQAEKMLLNYSKCVKSLPGNNTTWFTEMVSSPCWLHCLVWSTIPNVL